MGFLCLQCRVFDIHQNELILFQFWLHSNRNVDCVSNMSPLRYYKLLFSLTINNRSDKLPVTWPIRTWVENVPKTPAHTTLSSVVFGWKTFNPSVLRHEKWENAFPLKTMRLVFGSEMFSKIHFGAFSRNEIPNQQDERKQQTYPEYE